MKNYILLILSCFIISCSVENDTKKSEIGYEIDENGTKYALMSGDLSTVDVWAKYLEAHNSRDLESIAAMNFDDIKIYAPDGNIIEGSDAHIGFLSDWFNNNSPKWKTHYMIANELTKGNELEQWVTSCHEMTLTVEGNTIKVNQIHDAQIVDGKIKKFYVNERVLTKSEE